MNWLSRLLGVSSPKSAEVASERLQLVLKYDRARIPPGLVDTLKDELLAVIRRHVDVVEEGIEVSVTSASRPADAPVSLVANVPIRGVRRAVPARR